MDDRCWGVISDHLRDYCGQVGSLEFQHLDADFFTLRQVLLAINSNDIVLNRYFAENNLIERRKSKTRMVVLFTFIKILYCFVCKAFAFDSEKIMLASVGYGDWKHAPGDLARYESSNKHLSYLSTYISRRAKRI